MTNFKGPLRVVQEPIEDPDGMIDTKGHPIVVGHRLRFFATTQPEGEEVEVELRAGRGGVVFATTITPPEPVEGPELPPNEAQRPVPPEARTTPIRVEDFVGTG